MEVSPLVRACAEGNEELVKQALEDGLEVFFFFFLLFFFTFAKINREPPSPISPLFAAACEGHLGCVKLLLEHKGNTVHIDDGDHVGRSPLYAACVNGDCVENV